MIAFNVLNLLLSERFEQRVRTHNLTDTTKLPQPQPDSFVNIVFLLVQKLFMNLVKIAHYSSWHFSDFQNAHKILQDDYHVPKTVSWSSDALLTFTQKQCHGARMLCQHLHYPNDNCSRRNDIVSCPF